MEEEGQERQERQERQKGQKGQESLESQERQENQENQENQGEIINIKNEFLFLSLIAFNIIKKLTISFTIIHYYYFTHLLSFQMPIFYN